MSSLLAPPLRFYTHRTRGYGHGGRQRQPRAINPAIYGVAYATTAQLQDLNAPLHRYGGNNTSRYNWQLNADNRGADWYFQSIAESSATPGQRGDDFVLSSQAGNAEPMITVPIIEYVAKLGETGRN